MSNKKILMVLTSHSELGNTGEKTGFWVEEFAAPYYVFSDAGADITLSSPAGGQPPIDPTSKLADFETDATKRFDRDIELQSMLAETKVLADVKADDFDAVFYPGGHGPLWDLTDNANSISLIENFATQNKPISTVCHATAALLNAKDSAGNLLINNRAVTGFSNTEEAAVELTDVVPFLLEDALNERGGNYQKGDDWGVFSVQDDLLITGQNPASSAETAQKVLAHLNR